MEAELSEEERDYLALFTALAEDRREHGMSDEEFRERAREIAVQCFGEEGGA